MAASARLAGTIKPKKGQEHVASHLWDHRKTIVNDDRRDRKTAFYRGDNAQYDANRAVGQIHSQLDSQSASAKKKAHDEGVVEMKRRVSQQSSSLGKMEKSHGPSFDVVRRRTLSALKTPMNVLLRDLTKIQKTEFASLGGTSDDDWMERSRFWPVRAVLRYIHLSSLKFKNGGNIRKIMRRFWCGKRTAKYQAVCGLK